MNGLGGQVGYVDERVLERKSNSADTLCGSASDAMNVENSEMLTSRKEGGNGQGSIKREIATGERLRRDGGADGEGAYDRRAAAASPTATATTIGMLASISGITHNCD